MKILFKVLINIIDHTHKNKIISFFKSKLDNKAINIIDVGAHKGETIELFSKNFNLKWIFYEASKENFHLKIKKKKNRF